MVDPNRFYTYAYLREDRTPYYIGKGSGKRIYIRNRRYVKPPKDKSRIIFLKKNLTEEEAFQHEKYMIEVFGRKDLGTGILHNKSEGGQGSSGYKHSVEAKKKISNSGKGRKLSDETKKKMSEVKKGKSPSKKISEETRLKMSLSHKGRPAHNKGKSPSLETRKKISDRLKGRIVSEETRAKISQIHKGKTLSEEMKKRLSEVNTGKTMSDETKRKLSIINSGKNHPQYGKPKSEETKKKIQETKRNKINNSSK
jgi:hypothetical protein